MYAVYAIIKDLLDYQNSHMCTHIGFSLNSLFNWFNNYKVLVQARQHSWVSHIGHNRNKVDQIIKTQIQKNLHRQNLNMYFCYQFFLYQSNINCLLFSAQMPSEEKMVDPSLAEFGKELIFSPSELDIKVIYNFRLKKTNKICTFQKFWKINLYL